LQYFQFYWQAFADTWNSDVAFDDIEISPGACNNTLPVEFERG